MSRSNWKGVFLNSAFSRKKSSDIQKDDFVYNKNGIVPRILIGQKCFIYGGSFLRLQKCVITEHKVGGLLGEYVSTRKFTKKEKEESKNKKKKSN